MSGAGGVNDPDTVRLWSAKLLRQAITTDRRRAAALKGWARRRERAAMAAAIAEIQAGMYDPSKSHHLRAKTQMMLTDALRQTVRNMLAKPSPLYNFLTGKTL